LAGVLDSLDNKEQQEHLQGKALKFFIRDGVVPLLQVFMEQAQGVLDA
jgi:hypothetical protein